MRKRKSYKRDVITKENISSNVVTINPYIINKYNDKKGKNVSFDFSSFCNGKNEVIIKKLIKSISNYKFITFRGVKNQLQYFVKFLDKENINTLSAIDFIALTKYKIYLSETSLNKNTKRTTYNRSLYFLEYIRKNCPDLLHEDIINEDVPKTFKVGTKSAAEKDMEHLNKGYSDDEYKTLLFRCIDIIKGDNEYYDKIFSYLVVMALITGANRDVLLSFTDNDLEMLSKDFEYLEFSKHKGRKGKGGSNIKITIKNYTINNSKISEISNIIFQEKNKLEKDLDGTVYEHLLFTFPRLNKGGTHSNGKLWGLIYGSDYSPKVKYVLKKHNININSNFTFTGSRKFFERKIHKITKDITLTSSLMGHSTSVSANHYLNTSASTESHQKLGLTQDTIKGFSKNIDTDNFVVYQKLLDFYNIDLEKALELANKGFSIEKTIKSSQKEKESK